MKYFFLYSLLLSASCFAEMPDSLLMNGKVALQKKQKQLAFYYFNKILEQDPHNINATLHLAATHFYANEGNIALSLFKQCYESDPTHQQYLYGYAVCANHLGYHTIARDVFEKQYGAEPSNPNIRTKLLPIYLRNMDWYYALKLCRIHDLWWYDKDIQNKHIVLDLSSESNGRGDIMQIIRYAKHLYKAGAHVTIYMRHQLKELLSLCPYIDNVILADQPKPSNDHEYLLTTDRLTLIMRSELYGKSEDVPYIFADSKLVHHWKQKISSDTNFKVGICFQSVKMQDYFTGKIVPGPRAISPKKLLPLLSLAGISFYSLQIGEDDATKLLQTQPNFFSFEHFDQEHGAFMDTAALMKELDLVLTVDTSIAHLAGALGVPVWVMLPFSCDFRWLSARSDSPWYPSMRLFRQSEQGKWKPVIQKIKDALSSTVL